MRSHAIDQGQVHRDDQRTRLVGRGKTQHVAIRICNEALSPEFDSLWQLAFLPSPIDGHNKATVGHSMCPLNQLPAVVLGCTELTFFGRMAADCDRIKENLRAPQCCMLSRFGKPLVTVNENFQLAEPRRKYLKTRSPGTK